MKLSIGNIPQNLSEEDINKLFSEFGEVTHLILKRDKKTGTSLGYGSLELSDEGAHKAIATMNGKEVEGKKLAVVDSAALQQSHDSEKGGKASGSSGKINPKAGSSGGFTGSAPRRSGGGGRGK